MTSLPATPASIIRVSARAVAAISSSRSNACSDAIGLHRTIAASTPSDRCARAIAAGSVGRIDPVLQLDRRLAGEEEREPVDAVADEGHPELLELLRGGRGIHDRFRAARDQDDGRSSELRADRRRRPVADRGGHRRCRRSRRPRSPSGAPPGSSRSPSSRPASPTPTATGTSRRATLIVAPAPRTAPARIVRARPGRPRRAPRSSRGSPSASRIAGLHPLDALEVRAGDGRP